MMSAQKASISMTEEMMEKVELIQAKTGQSRSGVIQMLISAGLTQLEPVFLGNQVLKEVGAQAMDTMGLLKQIVEKFEDEQ